MAINNQQILAPLSKKQASPAFCENRDKTLDISMFNGVALKKRKRLVARFPSYGAKCITDTERNILTLLR